MATQSLLQRFTSPLAGLKNFFQAKSAVVRAYALKHITIKGLFGNPHLSLSFAQAVELGYKGLVWVYRCVNVYGDAVGSVRWVAYRVEKDGTETLLPDHPLEQLMSRPNPYMDKKEFYSLWAIYLMLSGECFWEVSYDTKKMPVHLYVIRPDWIKPKPDPDRFTNGYTFEVPNGGRPIHMENEDVIWFKFPNPQDPYAGMPPLTAGMRAVESENRVTNWNNALLENNAVPGGVLSIPAVNIHEEERREILESLEEEYTRDNIYRPMVLWGGMQWQQMSLSTKDLDFAGLKNLNKQEIHGVLGVPEELTNANPAAKYENKAVARQMFWEDRVIPMLDWMADVINMRLAPLYRDGVKLRPDVSSNPAMLDAFMRKVKTAVELVNAGWGLNMVNRRLSLGMGDVPWGDVAWMASSKVPVSGPESLTGGAMPNEEETDREREDNPKKPSADESEDEARQEDDRED